ncbi:MAG: MraY family glycosyltransferase [Flavobacteriales bacterium]
MNKITTDMDTFIIQSTAFVFSCLMLTWIFIQCYSKISHFLGLVDKPGNRKVHEHSIPLVGGISLFSSLTLSSFLSPLVFDTIHDLMIPFFALVLIFLMSVCDDRFDISAKLRLFIQIAAAILVANSGVRIESLFGMFGIFELSINLQYLLTILILVGATNAFNLIDGIDGLAGSLGLVITIVLAIISLHLGLNGLFLLCLGLIAGLVAFLKHNLFPAKIFMGDAGSMTLGFLLTLISIVLLQKGAESSSSKMIFILISCALIVPVIDALRVFIKRFSRGYSILKADNSHLHHLLLNDKKNHQKVVKRIVLLQVGMFFLGVLFSEFTSVTVLLMSLFSVQIIISKVLMINKMLSEWQEQLRSNEKSALM